MCDLFTTYGMYIVCTVYSTGISFSVNETINWNVAAHCTVSVERRVFVKQEKPIIWFYDTLLIMSLQFWPGGT